MLIYLLLCTLLEAYKILEMEIHPTCKPLEAFAPLCKAVLVKRRPGFLFLFVCLLPIPWSALQPTEQFQTGRSKKQFLLCVSQREMFERDAERFPLSCLLTPSQNSTHENKCILTGLQQQYLFEKPVFLTIKFQNDNKIASSGIHC